MKTGVSSPDDKFVTVEAVTKLGDRYIFPAMGMSALQSVVPKGSNRVPSGTPTLALVNASYAVISIPFAIIKTIKIDEEIWWESPA